ncbi:MAG: aminodeoxychorismate/anthranilate synthase component II [Calditrichaeota bacterium]|nr:aminodeoxychorismate/anthranilate synthase component II [Calditrichota bacterium]
MIVFIDNYDSFTYNLVDYFGQLSPDIKVFRNDRCSVEEIRSFKPQGIVISPGPGTPDDAGISCDLIREIGNEIPVLGICLGHQCIGKVFGARIIRAYQPVHGKTSPIFHNHDEIFSGIPSPFEATRYHSLIVEPENLPNDLHVIAETEDHTIMAIRHRYLPVVGIQFHPESILTDHGFTILSNWFRIIHKSKQVNLNKI